MPLPAPIPIGRSDGRPVYLSPERRAVHQHVIGASGQGKSKYLEHCIREDIIAGHGVCLIDPEGDLYDHIVVWCAENEVDKLKRIHLFDPRETAWRFRFNPLHVHEGEKPRHRVDNVIEALAQVWGGEDSRNTPAIRTTLRAIFAALIESGYSMAEAFYLTSTKDPDQIIAYLTHKLENPILREVWDGYQDAPPQERMIEFSGARRRFIELLADEEIREILSASDNPIDFREAMDNGDIVLVNLSPEAMGEDPARAFGALLVREMFYCASRRDPAEAAENPFYAYIDECAPMLTSDITRILARSRKRGFHVILAHQWLEQLREQGSAIYHGVMGIQNKVVFGGLSDEDATILADQLFRSEYDLETPIHALTKPGVAGYRRTWFHSWSSSTGTATSAAHTTTDSWSHGSVESVGATESAGAHATVSQVYDDYGWPTGTYSVASGESTVTVDALGVAVSTGEGGASSYAESETTSESESEGMTEGLEPILQQFVGGVHSLDNVRHMAIARLRSIPPRNAVVKGFNAPTFDIVTYDVEVPLASPEWIARFKEHVLTRSQYAIDTHTAREAMRLTAYTLRVEADKFIPGPRGTPLTLDHEDPDDGLG